MDILDVARLEKRVDVESLAERFGVTPQTIRKDLNDLCEMEKLQRVHGGAIFPSSTENLGYQTRRDMAWEAKQAIAKRTSELIPDNASIFLNIGTTTECVAHAIKNHRGLMVITNNLNVAFILSQAAEIEVIVAGGVVRKTDNGIVGAMAVDLIQQFKVDYAVIGASAIDEEGSLLDFDYREVRVSQAILEQSRQSILVADSTKFDRKAPVKIGHLEDINTFITDTVPQKTIVDQCAASNVELIISHEIAEKETARISHGR